MEHLTLEALARLVDESPTAAEAEHLARCRRCRGEVDGFRIQTTSLSYLPDLRPPTTAWGRIESQLISEGLLRPSRSNGGGGFGRPLRAGWLQVAAAAVLLLGGAGLGIGVSQLGGPRGGEASSFDGGADTGITPALLASLDLDAPAGEISIEEAAELVRITEGWYTAALVRYRESAAGSGGSQGSGYESLTRFAAIEALMAAGQAAVRESPTDPFLNGLLVNMRAEREATLRGIQASSSGQNWY